LDDPNFSILSKVPLKKAIREGELSDGVPAKYLAR
jgi:hypothetical protein